MMELIEKAEKYAVGKANTAMDKAIAQAYADGYRDGYTDRENEIPINLRENKTEYVDLGLPSGTLWSVSYEEEGGETKYISFADAICLSIPTEEQWNELSEICVWEHTYVGESIWRFDCIGPNGGKISFYSCGYITNEDIRSSEDSFFWLNGNTDSYEKPSAYIGLNNHVVCNRTTKYSGYKLPIRLVITKKEE